MLPMCFCQHPIKPSALELRQVSLSSPTQTRALKMSFPNTDDALAGISEIKRGQVYTDEEKNAPSERSIYYEDDGVHDGLEFPTEEERHTLRRVSDKLPWAAYRKSLLTKIPSVLL